MNEFVNYYEEFSIPANASLEEIKKILTSERKKWNMRQNTPDLAKRQGAERKLLLLDDATEVFQDDYTRKIYDNKLSKNKDNTQTQARPQSAPVMGNNADEIILRIKNTYNVGNNDAVIDLCNRALDQGFKNMEIYDYLCSAYEESQKYDLAMATAKTALYVTNHNWFKYLIARYDVFYFNNIEEAKMLIEELKSNQIDAASAMALAVEIDLRLGNEEEALRQVDEYIANHPNNNDSFKQNVAYAYLRYSDTFLTTANDGFMFWQTAEAYNNSLRYRKMAYELCSQDNIKETITRTESFNVREFDKEDMFGPICILLLGLYNISNIFGWLLLGLFGWIMYAKSAPKWVNERDDHAGVRPLPKHIARISTNVAKIIGKIILDLLSIFARSF